MSPNPLDAALDAQAGTVNEPIDEVFSMLNREKDGPITKNTG